MIKYASQYIDKEDIKIVSKVLRGNFLTQGPEVKKFEKKLSNFFGCKYSTTVSSGTAGLKIALMSLDIKKNQGIIVPAITFIATVNAAKNITDNIFIADIEKDTGCLSISKLKNTIKLAERKKIKIKCLINMHYAGQGHDLIEISNFCKRKNIFIVDDACHSMGSGYEFNKKKYLIGSCKHSDITVFSFHSIKNITTGEGGCILTNSKKINYKTNLLRAHGIERKKTKKKDPWFYNAVYYSENYRLTDFQCALGISQLEKINKFKRIKDKLYNYYIKKSQNYNKIFVPIKKCEKFNPHWHLFSIIFVGDLYIYKKKLFNFLKRNKINTQVHYIPLYKHEIYKDKYIKEFHKDSEEFYLRELSLPFHSKITKSEIDFIFKKIDVFINQNKINLL